MYRTVQSLRVISQENNESTLLILNTTDKTYSEREITLNNDDLVFRLNELTESCYKLGNTE